MPIDILYISLGEAKVYRDIQTNHKNYTKFQLAIFGAYKFWDEVEKNSRQRQKQGKRASGSKGKTAEIVGSMSGVNEKYAQYAHELLRIARDFFYETFFIKRYSLKKDEIRQLCVMKNDENLIKEIITEMKNIIASESNLAEPDLKKSVYERAKKIVDERHKPIHDNLIRKLTASVSEAEELKNNILVGITENNKSIPSTNLNTIDFACEEMNLASSTIESDATKTSSTNKALCVLTSTQPLSKRIQLHIKRYIETNSNYTVEIRQGHGKENIL